MKDLIDKLKQGFLKEYPDSEGDTFTIKTQTDLGFEEFFVIQIDHKDSQGFVSWLFVIVSDEDIVKVTHYEEGNWTDESVIFHSGFVDTNEPKNYGL